MFSKKTNKNFDIRLNIIGCIFYFAFFLVICRLFKIQVIDHKKYSYAADQQHWGKYEIPAIRGEIYSSDNYLLVGTQNYYLLYGEPTKIVNKAEVSKNLAKYFSQYEYNEIVAESSESAPVIENLQENLYNEIFADLSRDLQWVPLQHRVSPIQKEEIEKLSITGIGFQIEPTRYYPENNLLSHVLGFVASDESGETRGYFGIEGAFNEDLKGRKGKMSQEVDALGIPLLIGSSKETPAIQGSKIYLTIDRTVQFIVEQKLKEGVEKYNAKSGTVIVMDPFTGGILAMANYPSYNPSKFNDSIEESSEKTQRKKTERMNLAISQTYEPGSIMKPMTVAAAIDLGIVTEDTTFEDTGPVEYSGKWIDNWDGKHHSTQTVTQLLQKSNNIGAAWVGTKVGSRDLHKYFSAFGLGELSHTELEGEDTGILRDYNNWTDIDLANISFGQGISATPLQMLNAVNVLTNGGFLIQPKIILRIEDNSKITETPTKIVRRVISKKTSDTMIDLLEKAAEGGEAKFFILKDYRVSGKTGTAQIPIDGKYDPNKTNASFVGFLSKSKKYTMIVKLEQPHTSIFAAETAVPLWMEISRDLVKYYSIAPDK